MQNDLTSKLVIHSLAELVTNDEKAYRIQNAWIAFEGGKVCEYGVGASSDKYRTWSSIDGRGKLLMPGMIDCHTHLIFGGDRSHEFGMKLNGATYQEIAAAGGGIRSSVQNTVALSDEELEKAIKKRLNHALKQGITAIEVKSGYALDVHEELRHLRILKNIRSSSSQKIVSTCLALHARPIDQSKTAEYLKQCEEILLPTIKKEDLASGVDAFIEDGYYSCEDVESFFFSAQKLGLDIRIHADEFSRSGGAAFAARFKAKSADHLQFSSPDDAKAMAQSGVVAVLLPGTSLVSKIPFTSAKIFLDAGCEVAIASDFNPGSCPISNLRMLATVGALHCGLNLEQTIRAITAAPAKALGLEASKGKLIPGFDADCVLFDFTTVEQFLSDFGQTLPEQVFIAGKKLNSNYF